MRWVEVCGGLKMPINNEEKTLVGKITEDNTLLSTDLDDREKEVARKLVSRGVLNIHEDDNSVYYSLNKLKPMWRD